MKRAWQNFHYDSQSMKILPWEACLTAGRFHLAKNNKKYSDEIFHSI
jgi:hypothetical protein